MPRCIVGVDLGGTNVRAALWIEDDPSLRNVSTSPSRAQEGPKAVVEAIAASVEKCVSRGLKPSGVGLAVPGHIDDQAGVVRWAPNFRMESGGIWLDVPLQQMVSDRLGLPAAMGNDANLAALGEYEHGSGKGAAKCLVMITLGTGVGGGVILSPSSVQGKADGPLILVGGNRGGAELGHTWAGAEGKVAGPIAAGSLEAHCGKRAIVELAKAKIAGGRAPVLSNLVADDEHGLTPKLVTVAAEKGDPGALEVWEEVGQALGRSVGSFINIFAPDIVAIGGQISKAGQALLNPVRRAAKEVAIPTLFEFANIRQAERVDDAGLLGAVALACQFLK